MKIFDDRGTEHERRSGIEKVRGMFSAAVRTVIYLGVVVIVVLSGFAASCIGSSWVLGVAVDDLSAAACGVAVAMGVALIAVPFYFSQRKSDDRAELSESDVRFCRSCGYALDGQPVESDSCRVCPECGAAWKVVSGKEGSP